jgi:hypothetical protein
MSLVPENKHSEHDSDMQFISNIAPRSLTVSTQNSNITKIVIKMDTVRFTCINSYFIFMNVKFQIIFGKRLLCQIIMNL